MTSIMDIDKKLKTGLRDLEAIADEARPVPSDLRLEALIDNLEMAGEILCNDEGSLLDAAAGKPRRLVLRIAGIAASLALVAGAALAWNERPPKDTFDDPALAYAEVEAAFAKIGRSLSVGMEAMYESGERFVRPVKAARRIADIGNEE